MIFEICRDQYYWGKLQSSPVREPEPDKPGYPEIEGADGDGKESFTANG